MTDYDKILAIHSILTDASAKYIAIEKGNCPEGMTDEQWEDVQLSDVRDQIAEGAIADIRSILCNTANNKKEEVLL